MWQCLLEDQKNIISPHFEDAKLYADQSPE